MKEKQLEEYYEKEGFKFSLNDYYIGVYQYYSSHACRIAVIKKWLNQIKKNETFFEAGCAFGYFTHFMAKKGIESTGIDLSNNKIKIARYIANRNELNCHFYKMNIQNIEFEDDSFDWILNTQVLEHVPDDTKALSEIYRITKKYAIITVPKKGSFWDFLHSTSNIRGFDKPGHGHLREYTAKNIIKKVKKVGFKIYKIKFAGFISPRVDLIFRYIPFMQAITCLLLKK